MVERRRGVRVVTDGAHHGDLPAEQGRRDRLVGALAAGGDRPPAARDGLAGQRVAVDPDHQVGIDGADHDDPAG
ncbi:hypothetical protein SDC9_176062 [bioreactor metagenome]|uniref:Uncharacterized protein n=1 Tax=bioreactor metagenome TaxID=1076179 RepID=A0A645GS10_9ZZZZ